MPGYQYMPRNEALTILGLTTTASEQEITQAYRKLALQHHPDKPEGNKEKFQQLRDAKESLDHYAKPIPHTQTSSTHTSSSSGMAGYNFQPATPQQKKQWAEEDFQTELNRISEVLKTNLSDLGYQVGRALFSSNEENIKSFATKKKPIHHYLSGEKEYGELIPTLRLTILEQILNTIHDAHNAQNHAYITQELLDCLLDKKTNLAEVQIIFGSLSGSTNLNSTTIDFVISKPAYTAILASTLKHVSDSVYHELGDEDEQAENFLNQQISAILDFYSFFSVNSMESINFEADLLAEHTIQGFDAVITRYHNILKEAYEVAQQQAEQMQEIDHGGEEETKDPERKRTSLRQKINEQHEAIQTAIRGLQELCMSTQENTTAYADEFNALHQICNAILTAHQASFPYLLTTNEQLIQHYTDNSESIATKIG